MCKYAYNCISLYCFNLSAHNWQTETPYCKKPKQKYKLNTASTWANNRFSIRSAHESVSLSAQVTASVVAVVRKVRNQQSNVTRIQSGSNLQARQAHYASSKHQMADQIDLSVAAFVDAIRAHHQLDIIDAVHE